MSCFGCHRVKKKEQKTVCSAKMMFLECAVELEVMQACSFRGVQLGCSAERAAMENIEQLFLSGIVVSSTLH